MSKLNKIKRRISTCGYVDIDNFDEDFVHNVYKGNITNMFLNEDESELTLICLRPGLVIGKGGKNFDYIKQELEGEIGPIKLLIEEDKFWNC